MQTNIVPVSVFPSTANVLYIRSITLGPPPDLYFFRASGRPPHLGQLVTVLGEVVGREELGQGEAKGTLTQLRAEKWEIDPSTYASRHVSLAWSTQVRRQMRRELFAYQVEGAAWAASRLASGKGAILGDEPGTGKTSQTVAVVSTLRKWPVVIGCPASLPTSGFAHVSSGITVEAFLKRTAVARANESALRRMSKSIVALADHEGFPAHGNAIRRRFN